ncbi:MAG: carbohydrate ABC transporter permease [Thermoplasmata archaeon]|nr:carbohydrate ABC transporter permease [Candidatus Sysuiplasma acidicola]MBX8646479.1 carbohydrate ABC transporter permease [Candidatus Sysuiplasma acidicola]
MSDDGSKDLAINKLGPFKRLVLMAAMITVAIVYVIPFYWMVLKASRNSILANFPPDLNPFSRTSVNNFISNIHQVWGFGSFPTWYFNSILVSSIVVTSSVMVGAMAGYAFARLKFRGRDVLFYVVLGTLMIPFPVILIASYVFMVDIGWINTYQGLILPQIASAVNVFLMRQYFLTIPSEIEDAAKIDGLRPWQIFYRISAPLAKPAFAASAIYTFIGSWNNFLWPLLEAQTVNYWTIPLALNFFKGANGTQIYWNQMMTADILALIPTFIIYMIFERYFIQGISLTGTKG